MRNGRIWLIYIAAFSQVCHIIVPQANYNGLDYTSSCSSETSSPTSGIISQIWFNLLFSMEWKGKSSPETIDYQWSNDDHRFFPLKITLSGQLSLKSIDSSHFLLRLSSQFSPLRSQYFTRIEPCCHSLQAKLQVGTTDVTEKCRSSYMYTYFGDTVHSRVYHGIFPMVFGFPMFFLWFSHGFPLPSLHRAAGCWPGAAGHGIGLAAQGGAPSDVNVAWWTTWLVYGWYMVFIWLVYG